MVSYSLERMVSNTVLSVPWHPGVVGGLWLRRTVFGRNLVLVSYLFKECDGIPNDFADGHAGCPVRGPGGELAFSELPGWGFGRFGRPLLLFATRANDCENTAQLTTSSPCDRSRISRV